MKRELRDLIGQVEAREREQESVTAELEELERGTAQMSEDLEQLRTALQTREKDAVALGHEQRKLAEEYARAGSRLSVARLELDLAQQNLQVLQAQFQQGLLLTAVETPPPGVTSLSQTGQR